MLLFTIIYYLISSVNVLDLSPSFPYKCMEHFINFLFEWFSLVTINPNYYFHHKVILSSLILARPADISPTQVVGDSFHHRHGICTWQHTRFSHKCGDSHWQTSYWRESPALASRLRRRFRLWQVQSNRLGARGSIAWNKCRFGSSSCSVLNRSRNRSAQSDEICSV